jgi:large subunit ribosomal protein L10
MNRTEKMALANELKEKFQKSSVSIFADYKGLSAGDADSFRRVLREKSAEVRVLKNNVARLLTKDEAVPAGLRSLLDETVGPTMVTFAYGDLASTAKVVHEFSKKHEALKLKDSVMGETRLAASEVEALANLPSREVLLSTLLGVMQAPVQNFVNVLAGVPRAVLNVLSALEKKKEEGSTS